MKFKIGNIFITPFKSNVGLSSKPTIKIGKENLLKSNSLKYNLLTTNLQHINEIISDREAELKELKDSISVKSINSEIRDLKTVEVELRNQIEDVGTKFQEYENLPVDELSEIRLNLKDLIKKDKIENLFDKFEEFLKIETDKYNELVLLQSRYRRVNKKMIKGLISENELDIKINNLLLVIIYFIDDLKKTDLKK